MPKKSRTNKRKKSFSSNTFQQLEDRRMLATFVVNNLLDAPVNNPTEVPGSLRQAIFDANETPGADTIVFEGFASSGTIPLSAGTLEVTESVDIVGPGSANLTIDAAGNSSIFQFGDETGASTFGLSGLTLTGGNGQNNSGIGNFGGAVLFFDQFGAGGEDTLNVSDSVIANNTALIGGGLHAVMGTVNVTDTTFDANSATRNNGQPGGGGLSLLQTDSTLTRVTVSGNTSNDRGGGIANFADTDASSTGDAILTIIDSTITGNTADGGAGVFNLTQVDTATADAIVSVSGTTITDNRATALGGGGIHSNAGEVIVSNSLFENNTATASGADGGGIFGLNANVEIANTTFSNNRVNGTAGAIFVASNRGLDPEGAGLSSLDIANSTITESTNPSGRAVTLRAESGTAVARYRNSLFSNNQRGNLAASAAGGAAATLVSGGHNLSDDSSVGFNNPSDQTDTDPLLLPLADNGGDTLTHALRLESPAIDAGSNALAVDSNGNALATDQRGTGFDRVLDGTVDVGAFESELFQGDLIVSTNTDVVDNDFSSGELSLREAVLIANARDGLDQITFDSAFNGQTITLTDDVLTGELQVTESVDIIGPGASNLTISGGDTTGIFHFSDDTGASTFSLSGLTLADGNGENDAINRFGGAVLFFDSNGSGGEDTLNISDSVIRDSDAAFGGGIHAVLGTLNISDSTLTANAAQNNTGLQGGGGLSLEQTDTTLERVNVTANTAANTGGGINNFARAGTLLAGDSNLTIIDSNISNNRAARAGGIGSITRSALADTSLIISGSTIFDNTATTVQAGGIRADGAVVTISNSLLSGNRANTGRDGGAIFTANSELVIENSTISGNSTTSDSGAIHAFADASLITGSNTGQTTTDIVNSTIAFNSDGAGSVTAEARSGSSSTIRLSNSIFADNADRNFNAFGSGQTSIISEGHNISDDTTGNLFAAGDQINTDPLLFPLADNGGLTETHALRIGSPAIDAGSNALAVDADGIALTTDQRGEGFARILDGTPATVDIGAFENKTLEGDIIVSENSDVVDSFTGAGQLSLREAVLIANDRPGADSITFDSALNGQRITLTEGVLQVTESADFVGPGASQLTISGDNNSNIFWFGDVADAATFSVDGLRFADGNGVSGAEIGNFGGALLFFDSFGAGGEDTLNITDSIIVDSTALLGGGLHATLGTLNVTDSNFARNSATINFEFGGGGLSLQQTDTTLERVGVFENTALELGGGIANFVDADTASQGDANLTIIDSVIRDNTADGGGGILNLTQSNSSVANANLTVSSTTISGNRSIVGNVFEGSGGGIRTDSGAVTISNSTLFGNSAEGSNADGGAIFAANADLQIENSTLSGNSATLSGEAIFIFSRLDVDPDNTGQSVATIDSSTVAFNDAGKNAILARATAGTVASLTLSNSIFANNSSTDNFATSTAGNGFAAVVSNGFNISDDGTGNLTATGDQPNTDPLLEALADNGGLTQTHRLQTESPAIDAGNSTLPTDQRGGARPFDNADIPNATGSNGSDIGAFETGESQSLLVTTNLDVVDEFDELTSIREAIAFANSLVGEDTITFDESLAGSTIALSLDSGFALVISDSLAIDASTLSSPLTIDAGGQFRVVNFTSPSGDLTLDGLTITGGITTGQSDGAGISFGSFDTLTVKNSTISGNTAGDNGGGIYVPFDGNVIVDNSTISGNTANDSGGGIHASIGDVTVINSTISGNTAGGDGGGIFTNSGDVTVNNSTISSNAAGDSGGGIHNYSGDVTVTNSTISNNSASNVGGGIFARYGNIDMSFSTVTGNTSNRFGGGIRSSYGVATLLNSTVSGNSSVLEGGGISSFVGVVTLINSTVSGNSSESSGGGIRSRSGTINVINSTIVLNESGGIGGGVYIENTAGNGSIVIANSIVANNTASGSPDDVSRDPEGGLTINNSLIGVADGLGTINGNVGNLTGTANSPLDPMLGELSDNGGPTLTHALLPGSPAIDAGSNALAVDADGNPLVFDQRGEGFDRILDGTVDTGAFEFDASDVVAPAVESIVVNNGDEQRSMVSVITVSFSKIVNVNAADFILENTDTGTNVTPTVSTLVVDGKTVATLTFSGTGTTAGSLDDGNYSLTVLDTITDAAGNVLDGDGDGDAGGNATDDFFRLFGDSNGDRIVNLLDFFQFRNAFSDPNNVDERFDANGDGAINLLDFFQFRSRFGTSI